MMTEQQEQTLVKSSRKRRIAAFLIDHVMITVLMVSIGFLLLGPGFVDDFNIGKLMASMSFVMLLWTVLYFAKDAIKGISIGKWVMGIMVRDQNDLQAVPSFGRLLVRNLFIVIWPVEFIVLATNEEKKRLGDNTAKTVVLKNPDKASRLPRALPLIALALSFFAFIFLFVGSAMKSSDAYKLAIREIEQNQEVIRETGGIIDYGMMPGGSVNTTNGRGEAQLQIKVLGKEKDLNVSAYLVKTPNSAWELVEMNLEPI